MHQQPRRLTRPLSLIVLILVLVVSCTPQTSETDRNETGGTDSVSSEAATIRIDTTGPLAPIDPRVLGTNLPAWLNPNRLSDPTFQSRAIASGTTVMRLPGGSWSNYYDWLACERAGQGIDPAAECYWPWAARPTDFIDFLQATGHTAMYTVNQNGTAQESAALVAFFNGDVNDTRAIGVDVRGRDWGLVSDWARLRRDNGNPEPLGITLWEVGNEIYGGKSGMGKDCVAWGWEDVWTCDGIEYVNGINSGPERRDGYLKFRAAMRAVDSTILVGAVGVPDQRAWNNWGNEVIAEAGDVMDFYSIHAYAYSSSPASDTEILAQPQSVWPDTMADIRAALDEHAAGRRVPIAVTEYNLFAMQEQDTDHLMDRAVNALFIADTIGQMMTYGVAMANQWDFAHGEGDAPTGYGLIRTDTFAFSPTYFVFPLWSRFGATMLPVTSSLPADTTLSVYAGKVDATTVSLLAINKTDQPIMAEIQLDGIDSVTGGSIDILQAESLESRDVTFNGVSAPADDLSDALPTTLANLGNPLSYTFAPYTITLLRLAVQ